MKTGQIQTLKVSRISDFGLYLIDEEGAEVLLPNRFTRLDMKEGDEVEVFVYHDSEDRLVASTEQPLIKVGEVAALKVVDKSIHGAFLEWGLSGKHLFLPNRNQQGSVIAGQKTVVYMYYYEGYSTREIAKFLRCPGATVRSRLSRARKILKEKLGGDF